MIYTQTHTFYFFGIWYERNGKGKGKNEGWKEWNGETKRIPCSYFYCINTHGVWGGNSCHVNRNYYYCSITIFDSWQRRGGHGRRWSTILHCTIIIMVMREKREKTGDKGNKSRYKMYVVFIGRQKTHLSNICMCAYIFSFSSFSWNRMING